MPSTRTAISLILALSAAILAFLFWLIYFQTPPETAEQMQLSFLPGLNAVLNALSATCLTAGIICIKRGLKRAHGYCMLGATLASACFLAGYLLHHHFNGDSKFLAEGAIRYVYFFILISHILLSIVVLPMILSTLYFAATRKWSAHRTLARYTYPIWLYVSVTGIAVFVFLRLLNP